MKQIFISDTHFGHEKYHNEDWEYKFWKKYNSINQDFILYHLGDLSDELLNKIYEKYNIEIPKVYNYVTRTGCMGCPYGSYKHDTEKELMLINDNQFKFVCEYFKESYDVLGIDIKK